MALKIAVCVKSVPDPNHYDKIKIDPVSKSLIREGIPSVINAADRHALELALTLKEHHGGEITTLSMGPPDAREQLYETLAMGADKAVLLSDRKLSGADTLATSYALSVLLKNLGSFDLILAGNESEDGATAHVPSQLGEWLGLPHIMDVIAADIEDGSHLTAHKEVEGGTAAYRLEFPCVVAVKKKINTVRHTTVWGLYEAEVKPLDVLSGGQLSGLNHDYVGLSGSPTQPGELRAVPRNRNAQPIEGTAEEVACAILAKLGALTQ